MARVAYCDLCLERTKDLKLLTLNLRTERIFEVCEACHELVRDLWREEFRKAEEKVRDSLKEKRNRKERKSNGKDL